MPKIEHTCEFCSGTFLAYPRKGQRICSKKCYMKSHSYRAVLNDNGTTAVVSTKTCAKCGTNFSVKLTGVGVGRKYCSTGCATSSLKRNSGLACKRCGKEFYAPPSANAKFCSLSCKRGQTPAKKGYKVCTRCREEKPMDMFVPSRASAKVETRALCRKCHGDDVIMAKQRRRARLNSVPCTLTAKEWNKIVGEYNNRCAYCGILPDKITMDHVVPISRGGEHTVHNVVPACWPCNKNKNAKSGYTPMTPEEVQHAMGCAFDGIK